MRSAVMRTILAAGVGLPLFLVLFLGYWPIDLEAVADNW